MLARSRRLTPAGKPAQSRAVRVRVYDDVRKGIPALPANVIL